MKTILQIAAGLVLGVVIIAGVVLGVAAYATRNGSDYQKHTCQVLRDMNTDTADLKKAGCQ